MLAAHECSCAESSFNRIPYRAKDRAIVLEDRWFGAILFSGEELGD